MKVNTIEDALSLVGRTFEVDGEWKDGPSDTEMLDWLETEMQQEQDEIRLMGKVVSRSLFRRNEAITRAAIRQAMGGGQ